MKHQNKIIDSEAIYGINYTPEFYVSVGGVLTAPSSATLTLWYGGVAKFTDQVCTIDTADTKKITYEIASANLPAKSEDYRLELKYVIGSTTYYDNFIIAVVEIKIYHSVTTEDLTEDEPDIKDHMYEGQSNYQVQIDLAFQEVKDALYDRRLRGYKLVDGRQLDRLVKLKAFELIYFSFFNSADDAWYRKYEIKRDKYELLLKTVILKYDSNQDGSVDKNVTHHQTRLIR